MAVLHPLECYLLETFSSSEHFAATRDAIIEWIDAHEAAYARLKSELDPLERSTPQWLQGDIVWGNRFLPKIRPKRDVYINAYIQRINNNPQAYSVDGCIDFNDRSFSEFRNGWMIEAERQRISATRERVFKLHKRLKTTAIGNWNEGDLTYYGQDRIYRLAELPQCIPRYVLDPGVRVEKDQSPKHTGIYLPDVAFAAAQLLHPDDEDQRNKCVRRGIRHGTQVDFNTGRRQYSWGEDELIETGWTLIRRVEGEFIKVPEQGFFPKGLPDELYTWPECEVQHIVTETNCRCCKPRSHRSTVA